MTLTTKQVPDTHPYALAGNPSGYPSKGPTCEALKRALSRAGAPTLPWRDFDQNYNQDLEDAWDWYDTHIGAGSGNNGYGLGRYSRLRSMKADPNGPAAGQYALDSYGIKLIQDEAGETAGSTDMEKLQNACAAFCDVALQHASAWKYNSSIRPVQLDQNPAQPSGTSDCSGSVIQIVDAARRKAGLEGKVFDPARQNWTGYGNTDSYEDDWPKVGPPFRVGDLAHFQNPRHVIFCIAAGDAKTAQWWSFGSEPPVKLTLAGYNRYPGEYLFTVRPQYL